MEFRSTNDGFVHFQGDIVSNVSSGGVQNSSHGVHLTGGSTGGIVTAAGDETNIALTVKGKGSGPLILGSSGSLVLQGGSTAPFAGFIRTALSSFSTPAANSTNIMVVESSMAITGVNSSHYLIGHSSNLSTSIDLIGVKPSTAGARMRFLKASTLAIATGTTARISFLAIRF